MSSRHACGHVAAEEGPKYANKKHKQWRKNNTTWSVGLTDEEPTTYHHHRENACDEMVHSASDLKGFSAMTYAKKNCA